MAWGLEAKYNQVYAYLYDKPAKEFNDINQRTGRSHFGGVVGPFLQCRVLVLDGNCLKSSRAYPLMLL